MRVCDVDRAVLGAGVLLGDRHVLTCAHVVGDVGRAVVVDFVGLPGMPSIGARILPECYVPRLPDGRGDVALLQLDRPQHNGMGTTLRRIALAWDRVVRTYGFPPGLEIGVHARAILFGEGGPGGEWLQMNAHGLTEQRIRRGFSGAGVVDVETGDVLGIVVSEYTDEAAPLSWMLPVETILNYVPRVAEWVTGDSGADEVFSKSVDAEIGQLDTARTVTDWLNRRDTGDLVMIIEGSELPVLRRAVALSSRELRPATEDAPEGTVPPVGSIGLALDASDRTVAEIARRIVERVGVSESADPVERLRVGIPPITIAVDRVDDAEDARALVTEVLKPLVRCDCRLLLGFRNPAAPSLALVRSWQIGLVGWRLDRLARKVTELVGAENKVWSLRADVCDEADVGTGHADALRLRLTMLRKADSTADGFRHHLEQNERAVARAARRAADTHRHLAGLLDERQALRGRLNAYKEMAKDGGVVEDVDLSVSYRHAREVLWTAPTSLPDARQAVREYQFAVQEALQRRDPPT